MSVVELEPREPTISAERGEEITVSEAARMLGMYEQSVRRLCATGALDAREVDREDRRGEYRYMIAVESVTAYRDNRRGRMGRRTDALAEYDDGEVNEGRRYRGRVLAEVRRQGMSVADFCEAMGVSYDYPYRVDHRVKGVRNPSPAYRQKASEILGVPVDQLFEELPAETP